MACRRILRYLALGEPTRVLATDEGVENVDFKKGVARYLNGDCSNNGNLPLVLIEV